MLGFGKVVFRIVLVCLSKNQIYFNFYNYLINKIITINVPELQEKEKISRLYTDDDIINNTITKYKINPIK